MWAKLMSEQPQPVTFEALKERWRKGATYWRNDDYRNHPPHRRIAATYDECADELEALEQQVQALRDEYQAYQGYDSIVKRLTALLGKP